MKAVILQTYEQLFKKLLREIEEINRQKSSQPQFLLARIKEIINKYLEDMFYATVFTKQDSERIYDRQWQIELTRSLYYHFQLIQKRNWSHFDFNMIELFEACMMEICDKYHVNANVDEKKDIPATIEIKGKIEKINKEEMTEFPGIVSLMQLKSYPLHIVLQEGKNYFSRMADYSVFTKIFNHKTRKFSFKAYYYDPENKIMKRGKIFPNKRDRCLEREIMITERPLDLYEIYDFKLGIKRLENLQRDVLKLFKSEDFRWMPLELSMIIVEYIIYEIPFKLIGQVSVQPRHEDKDAPKDVPKEFAGRPGLELFAHMKTMEVYIKYNLIFYYCENIQLINCWTSKKLKKGICFNYKFEFFKLINHGQLSYFPSFVKRSRGCSITQNLLKFISESSRKESKSGDIFQHRQEIYSPLEPLIYNFKIN